jgi:molecular chaperone DnaK
MGKVFGIDLGTTYSCIAYIDEYGKPIVLKNSEGEHTTPSVAMVESESNIIIGNEAKRSIEIEPEKTVQFIKRKMGKEQDCVILDGKEYHAPEISAWILKKIVNDANDELIQTGVIEEGQEIKDVVITCPAYFGMNERQATKTAGELAGLNVLNIINEPTAAAISYGVSGNQKEETVLVYDLGGGTFDITVMNISGNEISVVCTGGDDQLGGKDWDECFMDYVMQRYEEETGEDLSEDPETVAALYVDVETWKKALTTREKVRIMVNGPAGRFREELTRDTYEELTKDLLNRTKNLLDDVLNTAAKLGYPISRIDKVLLVGGSSRMPQISKMIENDYHVTQILADPDEAVAKGAAIYANNEKQYKEFVETKAQESGKTIKEIEEENIVDGKLDQEYAALSQNFGEMRINITNVLSRTYGVGAFDEDHKYKITNMLMINEKLPAKETKTFMTLYDDQDGVDLKIYESRSTDGVIDVEDKEPITTIHMSFNRTVPKGTKIVQTMALDNSGILHIIAEEQLYHSKLNTTFELSNQMTGDTLEKVEKRMLDTNIE